MGQTPMRNRSILLALLMLMPVRTLPAQETPVVTIGDATVTYDDREKTWSIGNAVIRLQLRVNLDADSELQVTAIEDPRTGQRWDIFPAGDTTVTIDGRAMPLGTGSREAGLYFQDFEASEADMGVRLAFVFEHPDSRAAVKRYYQCYQNSPAIETWTAVTAEHGGSVDVSNLNAWNLAFRPGPIRWLTGIEVPPQRGGSFTVQQRSLGPDEHLYLGAEKRVSEQALPLFTVEGDDATFFGGVMTPGSWAAAFVRTDERLSVSVGSPEVTARISGGGSVETPHGFFGFTMGGVDNVSVSLRSFVMDLRQGRPFEAPVIYNTWFAYGTNIDEESMQAEMDHAAHLGAEVFVLDAGWHVGAGARGAFDFTSGLGTWEWDERRFPSGPLALADFARSLGLRFGIWAEPERVALEAVGRPGLAKESWLATHGGRYNPGVPEAEEDSAQICLASPEARQWVLERLTQLVEEVHADYLKLDNNFWINCDREGHGHGRDDGNLAHAAGLYEILAALRARFPNLTVENCSGGGTRLDFELLRYTDTAWMDDRTMRSSRVRHNIEGLGAIFPPAYLLSFVTESAEEPVDDEFGLSLYLRSRMPGSLGLSLHGGELGEAEENRIVREVESYKSIRDIIRDASAVLLSDQVDADGGVSWDVIQETSASTGSALIFAFEAGRDAGDVIVRPRELRREAQYEILSLDEGSLGTRSGDDLMENGIVVAAAPGLSAAHVFALRRQ